MTKGKIIIIQGAQYGSEGKGMISAMEAGYQGGKLGAAVRTGGPNSGHTVYKNGRNIVMKQIPTAWATNDNCKLVLGPGAIINPEILLEEIKLLQSFGCDLQGRLLIHPNAAVILTKDKDESRLSGRYFSIGGTSEGSSSAVCRRLNRDANGLPGTIHKYCNGTINDRVKPLAGYICDTTTFLDFDLRAGKNVLIEGTQGCHLDLLTSTWPYSTHRACNSAALLAEAGLSPLHQIEVGLVARTFPIRVAGDSGYMPKETSWFSMLYDLGVKPGVIEHYRSEVIRFMKEKYGITDPHGDVTKWEPETVTNNKECVRKVMTDALNSIDDEELHAAVERTSVTNLVRRIAEFDVETIKRSVQWSGCSWLALTFTNYVDPEIFEMGSDSVRHSKPLSRWMSTHDLSGLDVPIRWVNTGPLPEHHHKL